MERKNFGYTLIELMVILAIMGFIAAVAFYGLRSYDNSQQVINAQKDFVNLLRATQNKVTNGADGDNYKSVNTSSLILPVNVSVSPLSLVICFNNPNLTSSSCTNTFPMTVTFTNGSTTKTVTINGSGLFITKIDAN